MVNPGELLQISGDFEPKVYKWRINLIIPLVHLRRSRNQYIAIVVSIPYSTVSKICFVKSSTLYVSFYVCLSVRIVPDLIKPHFFYFGPLFSSVYDYNSRVLEGSTYIFIETLTTSGKSYLAQCDLNINLKRIGDSPQSVTGAST